MTLSMVLEDIKSDSGLINDPAAAARNRQNIENMRLKESQKRTVTSLRAQPILKRVEIKKEENMASKYDNLKDTILEDLKTMNQCQCEKKNGLPGQTLFSLLNDWRRRGLIHADYTPPVMGMKKGKRAKKAKKVTVTPPVAPSKTSLPVFDNSWGDSVKVAWFSAFTASNNQK